MGTHKMVTHRILLFKCRGLAPQNLGNGVTRVSSCGTSLLRFPFARVLMIDRIPKNLLPQVTYSDHHVESIRMQHAWVLCNSDLSPSHTAVRKRG